MASLPVARADHGGKSKEDLFLVLWGLRRLGQWKLVLLRMGNFITPGGKYTSLYMHQSLSRYIIMAHGGGKPN